MGKLRSHLNLSLLVLLLVSTLSLVSCQGAPPVTGQPVAIAEIWDGQTFEVLQAGTSGPAPVIKLAGIEVPDNQQQPWGPAARQALRDLTRDRIITARIVSDPAPDSRIRWAYVWAGEQLLNQVMVAAGHAYINPSFAHPDYADLLQRSQDHARVMGYGIWRPEQPLRQTAGEFRRGGVVGLLAVGCWLLAVGCNSQCDLTALANPLRLSCEPVEQSKPVHPPHLFTHPTSCPSWAAARTGQTAHFPK